MKIVSKTTLFETSSTLAYMIYSAGRICPICDNASDVIFLKSEVSNQIFFACFSCACAWDKPPDTETVFIDETVFYLVFEEKFLHFAAS